MSENGVTKAVPDTIADARQLTEKLRAQMASAGGDAAQGATASLDQLDAALDVIANATSSSPSSPSSSPTSTSTSAPSTSVTTTTSQPPSVTKIEPAPAPAPAAPPTPAAAPVVVPTNQPNPLMPDQGGWNPYGPPPVGATVADLIGKSAPTPALMPIMAVPPPPPPPQGVQNFALRGADYYVQEKVEPFKKAMLPEFGGGGMYALDNALDLFKSANGRYDYRMFDLTYHATIRSLLDEGGFNRANRQGLLKSDIVSMTGEEIVKWGLMTDFQKGVSSTTAPGYYLQLLVKLMLPVLSPLGNRFPTQKPRAGGKQAEWRVTLGFQNLDITQMMAAVEASTTLGSTTGAGQEISETPVLFQAPYARVPAHNGVTLEAQYAMLGYQDATQMAVIETLNALWRGREHVILKNNKQALGALGTLTATTASVTTGMSGGTNDKFAVTALSGLGSVANKQATGGKGGASSVAGETAASVSAAVDLSGSTKVTLTWACLPGAVAYNLYYLPAGVPGNARFVGTVTKNKIVINATAAATADYTALPTIAKALTYPTVDGTANTSGYEGTVSWCDFSTIYGVTIPQKTVYDQAGEPLTFAGPNRIKEWDVVLADQMSNWNSAPSLIVGSPNSIRHATDIINSGTNPPYRIETKGMQGEILGGVWVTGYINNYAQNIANAPKVIDVMSHPYLEDGKFLFLTETIAYQMAQEARGWLIEQQIPLTYFPLASLTASWQFEMLVDEVLESFLPPAQTSISGVNVS